MFIQDLSADLIERSLHSLNLANDIDAINIFLDHSLDAADMALDCFQALQSGFVLHRFTLAYPPQGGGGKRIIRTLMHNVKMLEQTLEKENTLQRNSASEGFLEGLAKLRRGDVADPLTQDTALRIE